MILRHSPLIEYKPRDYRFFGRMSEFLRQQGGSIEAKMMKRVFFCEINLF